MSADPPQDGEIAPRYLRVAALVGKGLTYKQVASRLDLSVHTVHYYVHQLATEIEEPALRELSAKSRVMVWWLRERDTSSPVPEGAAPDRRRTARSGSPDGARRPQERSASPATS